MRALVASFAATALVVACTRSAPPTVAEPARVAEVPVVDAAPLPSADAGAPAPRTPADAGAKDASPPEEHVLAWTDPAPLAELTKSCAAQAPGIVRPKGVDKDYWEASPLSCAYGLYGQSCVVDPCFNEQKDVCHDKCERTCDGCAQGCTASCTTCKKACAQGDTACARTCAASCASCRQECLFAKDRCASGQCAKRYEECRKETQAKWVSSGCQKGCRDFYACVDRCPEGFDPSSACGKACMAKNLTVCTPTFRTACLFNGLLYEDPPGDER
jgi:hypothetical protein